MARMMSADQTANSVKEQKIILAYNNRAGLDLFTPGRKMPLDIKRAVHKHRAELINRMRAGDINLCPNRDLHRQYYKHVGQGRCVCEACARLEPWLHPPGGSL